jgi:hypothetical protein
MTLTSVRSIAGALNDQGIPARLGAIPGTHGGLKVAHEAIGTQWLRHGRPNSGRTTLMILVTALGAIGLAAMTLESAGFAVACFGLAVLVLRSISVV